MKKHFFIQPIFFFLCTIVLCIVNFFAFLDFFSTLLTLPLLFICIFLTLYTAVHRHRFRQVKKVQVHVKSSRT